MSTVLLKSIGSFQFTAPRRSWPIIFFPFIFDLYFNSQLHAGADLFPALVRGHWKKFQFTAPRRSWQYLPKKGRSHNLISIHSSTQELTMIVDNAILLHRFQFTAPRRSWLDYFFSVYFRFVFQFTAPRRSWRVCTASGDISPEISIHSSTQELTILWKSMKCWQRFQFTAPRRSWLILHNPHQFLIYFNSQLHAGADRYIKNSIPLFQISIHSSTQELTRIWF